VIRHGKGGCGSAGNQRIHSPKDVSQFGTWLRASSPSRHTALGGGRSGGTSVHGKQGFQHQKDEVSDRTGQKTAEMGGGHSNGDEGANHELSNPSVINLAAQPLSKEISFDLGKRLNVDDRENTDVTPDCGYQGKTGNHTALIQGAGNQEKRSGGSLVYEANVSTNSADSPPTYMESRDSHNGRFCLGL
jgi:hypothetical protein